MPPHLAKYLHHKYSWILIQLIHGNCMHGKCMHKKYMHRKCMHREYMSIVLCTYTLPHLSKSLCLEAGRAVTRRQGQKKETETGWQKVEREEESNYEHGGLGWLCKILVIRSKMDKMGKENTAGNHSWVQPWRFSLVEHKPGEKQTIKAKKNNPTEQPKPTMTLWNKRKGEGKAKN